MKEQVKMSPNIIAISERIITESYERDRRKNMKRFWLGAKLARELSTS